MKFNFKNIFVSICLLTLIVIGVKEVYSETLYTGGPIMNSNIAIGNSVLGFNATTMFDLTSKYVPSTYPAGALGYATNGSWNVTVPTVFGTVGNGCHVAVISNAWQCISQ